MEEKLKFTEEAKLDIKEAATYYNEVESHKLADDFLSSINEKIIQILIKPNAYSEDSDGVRKTTIRRFPYNIYYISISPSLLIIAIWHKKRNPDNLKNRIDKIKNK
ncbi:MAG: type II toxin-antitoxin system RelE/ParE family toxin [Leptospiraceae bacterium]|nr:type II toxin-antitoxin system RelE/ParE family toxin [Leptospiraceae bacterium]